MLQRDIPNRSDSQAHRGFKKSFPYGYRARLRSLHSSWPAAKETADDFQVLWPNLTAHPRIDVQGEKIILCAQNLFQPRAGTRQRYSLKTKTKNYRSRWKRSGKQTLPKVLQDLPQRGRRCDKPQGEHPLAEPAKVRLHLRGAQQDPESDDARQVQGEALGWR